MVAGMRRNKKETGKKREEKKAVDDRRMYRACPFAAVPCSDPAAALASHPQSAEQVPFSVSLPIRSCFLNPSPPGIFIYRDFSLYISKHKAPYITPPSLFPALPPVIITTASTRDGCDELAPGLNISLPPFLSLDDG